MNKNNWEKKFLLAGLTGNIATGKSTVSKIMGNLGAFIIDADLIAREVVKNGMPAYKEIKKVFSKTVLHPDGSINRKVLGKIVFQDPQKKKELEAIVHPPIILKQEKIIQNLVIKGFVGVVIVDAALLIESGYYKAMDKIIVVKANRDIQIQRMENRDKIPAKEAEVRIDAQMPMAQKMIYADYVIDNNNAINSLEQQVENVFFKLTALKNKIK